MAARDERDGTGDRAGDQTEPSPLDHHLGHREELTPLRPGEEPETGKPTGEGD